MDDAATIQGCQEKLLEVKVTELSSIIWELLTLELETDCSTLKI